MIADISFSVDAFSRFLSYRISDLFTPLATPFRFSPNSGQPATPHYLDGLKIRNMSFANSPRVDAFVLNEPIPFGAPPNAIRPVAGANTLDAARIAASPLGNIFLVAEDEVVRANYSDPAQVSVMIPPNINILLRLDVDRSGMPHLLGEVDPQPPIGGLPTLFDQPLPIGPLLGDPLPNNQSAIVNAGISLIPGERVVLRFEYGPIATGAATTTQRLIAWQSFFTGQHADHLGGRDWAIALPSGPLVDLVTRKIDKELSGQRSFIYYHDADGSWLYDPPGFHVRAHGHVENACAGNDLRFMVTITGRLSAPRPNVIRATVSLGFFKNDWDVLKCLFLTLVNPLAPLITAFDQREAGLALFQFAPPGVTAILAGALLFGAGEAIVRAKINEELEKKPDLIPISDEEFALEQTVDTWNPTTRDWIVLNDVTGADDQFVLRGAFNVPEPNMPRLTARLEEPFSKWRGKDPCQGSSPSITTARIALGLRAAEGAPKQRPNVSLKFAPGRPLEIRDDPDGVYSAAFGPQFSVTGSYTEIGWSIPGYFEVLVSNPPDTFQDHPYELHVRFFTSGGVRQFAIPAPPARVHLTREEVVQEALREAAWRLNNCYIHAHLFPTIKGLHVKWIPDPPPDAEVGQHWQIYVQGLDQGRQVTAWDQSTGRKLAIVRADSGGHIELSLVIPETRPLETLLLTLDDQPFLSEPAFRDIWQNAPAVSEEPGLTPVSVQQTMLFPLGVVPFSTPVAGVKLYEREGQVYLQTESDSGRVHTHMVSHALGVVPIQPIDRSEPETAMRFAASRVRQQSSVAIVEGVRTYQVRGERPREPLILGEYWERPWFDGGAVLDALFVQITEDGRSVKMYRRGFGQLVRPTGREPEDSNYTQT
jgi:hypothetical protein